MGDGGGREVPDHAKDTGCRSIFLYGGMEGGIANVELNGKFVFFK